MKAGLDTSILVCFIKGEKKVIDLLRQIEDKKDIAVVSVVSIAELYKYYHKQEFSSLGKEKIYSFLSNIEKGFKVVDLTSDMARKAAFLSHDIGLHMADALILATVVSEGCDEFYTTDLDFRTYKGKSPKIHTMSLKARERRS